MQSNKKNRIIYYFYSTIIIIGINIYFIYLFLFFKFCFIFFFENKKKHIKVYFIEILSLKKYNWNPQTDWIEFFFYYIQDLYDTKSFDANQPAKISS